MQDLIITTVHPASARPGNVEPESDTTRKGGSKRSLKGKEPVMDKLRPYFTYTHYIGESEGDYQRNDHTFSIGVWEKLFEDKERVFPGIKSLVVWSDGGSKHFKCTSFLEALGRLGQRNGVDMQYNFFVADHGWNICDAAASHAKSKLKLAALEASKPIRSTAEALPVISSLTSHTAHPAAISQPRITRTAKGINQYHHFSWSCEKDADVEILGQMHKIDVMQIRAHLCTEDRSLGIVPTTLKRYAL